MLILEGETDEKVYRRCGTCLHDFDPGYGARNTQARVSGGYPFPSTDGGWHANGWNTAANLYITKWLGGTGDFSGVYGSGSNLYTYTFGPVVSTHKSSFSPF